MDPRILDVNAAYLGVSTEDLMENAGVAVVAECLEYHSISFVCGNGNNGGDGLVAARILGDKGYDVTVYQLAGDKSTLNKINLERLPDNVKYNEVDNSLTIDFTGFELIVDCLFGTGFQGVVREPAKSIIEKINSSPAIKLSVDTPSAGIVEADMVLGLHNEKIMGSKVADIGIPPEAEIYCGPGDVIYAIPKRKPDSHKGDYGKLLVIAGCKDYIGTPTLVAQSALKVGVDLVYVSVPQYVADKMPFDPNLIILPQESEDYISEEDIAEIKYEKYDAVIVGNGIGLNPYTKTAIEKILSWNKPTVIDADAITHLEKEWIHDKCIITPHKAEFKRLFPDVLEITEEEVAQKALEVDATLLVKGETDIISNGFETRLNKSGNAYMSVGGTGDVLAGITAGLLAQNKKTYEVACAAAFLTGYSGELVGEKLAESLTATDLIHEIPYAIKKSRGYKI